MALTPTPTPGAPGAPPMPGPAGGVGGATTPTPMPGKLHQGMAGLKTAVEMLQKSIADLPMGSPLHQKVLKFVADVSKELGEGGQMGGGPGTDQAQQIASMARQGPNPDAQAAMQKLFPPSGGGAQPPQMAA